MIAERGYKYDKCIDILVDLIRKTQKGIIKWFVGEIKEDTRNVFETMLEDISFRLTKYWNNDYKLEVFDSSHLKIYEFPMTNVISDLYKSIFPDNEEHEEEILNDIIEKLSQ